MSFRYKDRKTSSNNKKYTPPSEEKKPCCLKIGRYLNFFAISVWVSYYFKIMMFNKAGLSTENISFFYHLLMFLVLILPGIYFTKFKNRKK